MPSLFHGQLSTAQADQLWWSKRAMMVSHNLFASHDRILLVVRSHAVAAVAAVAAWVLCWQQYGMPVALITPCFFFSQLMNPPAWGSMFLIYFLICIVEEFGPGSLEDRNILTSLKRIGKVVLQGIVGCMCFFELFGMNG
eukprot:COSAG02_NODE_104_length_36421_cov_132.465420_12_plen_140_part_00